MDIVVKGHRAEVTDRFRTHVSEKLSKLSKLDGKAISLDVELSRERNPRLADRAARVQITLRSRGPVIRAEACAPDQYVALDAASAKLEARLRKALDRRRVHHGRHKPVSVAEATAGLATPSAQPSADGASVTAAKVPERRAPIEVEGDGPLVVREKIHQASPMTLAQALYEMELVGHDFYLFVDVERKLPSVVYRRRGYDYGVLHLQTVADVQGTDEATGEPAVEATRSARG